jgi:hypothetical protein
MRKLGGEGVRLRFCYEAPLNPIFRTVPASESDFPDGPSL